MYQTECRAVLFFVLDVNFQARSYIESRVKRFSFIWKKVEALTETSWIKSQLKNSQWQTTNLQCHPLITITQFLNTCLHEEECFLGRKCTCSLFSLLSKFSLMFYNYVFFNDLLPRSRAQRNFVSFVSAWRGRCCETEMVLRMDNLCEQHSYEQ